MPAVEEFGVQPVPKELRVVGARDLFRIVFAMHLSPLQYVLGALAVAVGGLPLWWAAGAITLGNGLAFVMLVVVGQVGADYGLPGQVALRATLGYWGARALSSPYRMIAATYLFAAQVLAGSLGIQAMVRGLTGNHVRLVPIAVVLAVIVVLLAVIGYDALRHFVRFALPLVLVFIVATVVLYVSTDDPRYEVSRVLSSPGRTFTWVGFATFVTVMCSGALANVTNVADLCRYARSRRDVQIGFLTAAIAGAFVTAWLGAYGAIASGSMNPFLAIAALTGNKALLVFLLLAIVVQTAAVSIINLYSVGLSLVNAVPRLGRLWATALIGAFAIVLSAFPGVINEAQTWITHLGNVAAPLTGVILADYVVLKRTRIDVPALFDAQGRYRYARGVNPAAVAAAAAAAAVYYIVPDAWLKVAWGVAAGAGAYVAFAAVQAAVAPSLASPALVADPLATAHLPRQRSEALP